MFCFGSGLYEQNIIEHMYDKNIFENIEKSCWQYKKLYDNIAISTKTTTLLNIKKI